MSLVVVSLTNIYTNRYNGCHTNKQLICNIISQIMDYQNKMENENSKQPIKKTKTKTKTKITILSEQFQNLIQKSKIP